MIAFGATSWSQAMEQLLTEKDEWQPLYADSAYTGEDQGKQTSLFAENGTSLFAFFCRL